MTRREWIKEHHPEAIIEGDGAGGGVRHCPDDYKDLPDTDCFELNSMTCLCNSCTKCWDKEMDGVKA